MPVKYVIESEKNENFFCFLIYDIAVQSEKRTPNINKYQLKLKNEQLIEQVGISIFNKIYQIVDLDNLKKCLIVLEELLKEMKEIIDINKETDIEYLLNNVKDEEIKESFLKIILKYWQIKSPSYGQYRRTFEQITPYFHLYFSLKENNEDEFVKSFPDYLEFMKLNHISNYHKFLVEDCKYLLFAADHGNHEKAIKLIVGCYTNDKDLSDDYIQFMLNMIRNEFYLEQEDGDWIEPGMLEKYLNSCVSNFVDKNGDKLLKIDYNCLTDPKIREKNLESLRDESGHLLFYKSLIPVSMILENDKLKHLITHPMIALFATLKGRKFQKIHNFNLYAFLYIFTVPFLLLFMSADSSDKGCCKFYFYI